MARTIEVRLLGDEGAAELRPLGRLGEAHGPRRHSRWAKSMHFGDRLSAFWTDLDLRHRPRGERGTSWVELWVAFEALHGACPGAPGQMGARPRLEVKPHARTLLYNFMAASKWLLGPETVRHPTLLGTATTRGRTLRHLAVATTSAAIDAKVVWPGWLWEEIQCRALQLRGRLSGLASEVQGRQDRHPPDEAAAHGAPGALA